MFTWQKHFGLLLTGTCYWSSHKTRLSSFTKKTLFRWGAKHYNYDITDISTASECHETAVLCHTHNSYYAHLLLVLQPKPSHVLAPSELAATVKDRPWTAIRKRCPGSCWVPALACTCPPVSATSYDNNNKNNNSITTSSTHFPLIQVVHVISWPQRWNSRCFTEVKKLVFYSKCFTEDTRETTILFQRLSRGLLLEHHGHRMKHCCSNIHLASFPYSCLQALMDKIILMILELMIIPIK